MQYFASIFQPQENFYIIQQTTYTVGVSITQDGANQWQPGDFIIVGVFRQAGAGVGGGSAGQSLPQPVPDPNTNPFLIIFAQLTAPPARIVQATSPNGNPFSYPVADNYTIYVTYYRANGTVNFSQIQPSVDGQMGP
jgi:hypothetical protein